MTSSTTTESRFVTSMRHTIDAAVRLLPEAEANAEARKELVERLEDALDIIKLQEMALHRPQAAALAPPELS